MREGKEGERERKERRKYSFWIDPMSLLIPLFFSQSVLELAQMAMRAK